MTVKIDSLAEIASDYDVVVFDQWGVLHNGTVPYPGAVAALASLETTSAVLSNSGKRAAPNSARITSMGFEPDSFATVMTSGEALWRDIDDGRVSGRAFHAVERGAGDAAAWADGLDIALVSEATAADAILMMGLPDDARLSDWAEQLNTWLNLALPIYCSNPDRQSPRAGGLVTSPGTIAFAYKDMGGETFFYGKPHPPVFHAVEKALGAGRYLMVGDSMEHDIAGARAVSWDSLLVQGGLYKDRFENCDGEAVVKAIAAEKACAPPTYRIEGLR